MIEVSCGIIVNDAGQLLVVQRSAVMALPLKFEFPGGKIEENETPEICLIREIKEELNIQVKILSAMPRNIHRYPGFSICLFPFICKIVSGSVQLREHVAYHWANAGAELLELDWAEADIPVLLNYLELR